MAWLCCLVLYALGGEPLLRTSEADRRVALEVVSYRLEHPDRLPTVTLVGAVHIGDPAYYEAVLHTLDAADEAIVEGIRPPGGGDADNWYPLTSQDRINATALRIQWVGSQFLDYARQHRSWPRHWRQLVRSLPRERRPYVRKARVDAWGRPLIYVAPPRGRAPSEAWLLSLASDGYPGGQGVDTDLFYQSSDGADESVDRNSWSSVTGIEDQATALRSRKYRNVDLSIDQLRQHLQRAEVDSELLEGVSGASSAPSPGPEGIESLGVARFRLLLIHFLAGLSTSPLPGEEVVIVHRDQLVLQELDTLVGKQSVAVFYGARHLPDLEQGLLDRGYTRTETSWQTVLSVDLEQAGISAEEHRALEELVNSALGPR